MKYFKIIWLIVAIIASIEVISPLAYANLIIQYIFQSFSLFGFICIVWKDKDDVKRSYSFVFAVFFVFTTGSFLVGFFSVESPFKLQTITHRHTKIRNYRVESLWSETGIFGYTRKKELVFPLTSLFEWRMNHFDIDLNSEVWEEVNEDINELGLKGEKMY